MEDPSEEELPELVRLETNSEPTQAFNLSTEVFETTGDVVRRDSTIEEKPVPVTLITGFLGSGKSTLIQNILKEDHGFRIAVIVNEYGDSAGIEPSLIRSPDGEEIRATDWLELANGCLCCSAKSDFVAALEGLMIQKRDRFDYILIETTGLADPGPVATSLWTDTALQASICLDAIVTIADAKNILRHLQTTQETSFEAQRQLAYADLVLLNKMDLVNEDQVREIENVIRSVNASTEIMKTTRCQVHPKEILDRKTFSHEEAPKSDIVKETTQHDDSCQSHSIRRHLLNVGTMSFYVEGSLDLEKFQNWLTELLWKDEQQAEDVFRMKGVLNIKGDHHRRILQAVHELYEITEGDPWQIEEKRFSKIILIGRNLSRPSLLKNLMECQTL